jgi:spore coat polysaccharide biosynthesis protein SpsF
MNYDIIIQCRFSSSRFKGKILYEFDGSSFLDFLLKNIKRTKSIRNVIIAVPSDKYAKLFKLVARKNKVKFFAPSKTEEGNLLKRYYLCSKKFKSENIIRITSDCPFINPVIIDQMVNHYQKKKLNFLTNNKPRYVPHGFDCEIISKDLLCMMYKNAKTSYEREHVTPWIYKNIFTRKNNIRLINKNFSKVRLTLDYEKDYITFKKNIDLLKNIAKKNNYMKFLKIKFIN